MWSHITLGRVVCQTPPVSDKPYLAASARDGSTGSDWRLRDILRNDEKVRR